MKTNVQWLLVTVVLFSKIRLSSFFSLDESLTQVFDFLNIERCDNIWVKNDLKKLKQNLDDNIFGQPLAKSIVLSALNSHFERLTSGPLVLSFHGGSGVGKTYFLQFIINNLYKKGSNSKYVHTYVGSMHFPVTSNVEQYRKEIHDTIIRGVAACPQSLFIFDEVHKLQMGVLNEISSIIRCSKLGKCDLRKAIFIFISNTGSSILSTKTLRNVKEGKSRDDFVDKDLENSLMLAANQEGGLRDSDLIKEFLISHFVPFLPLELEHVEQCIQKELKKLGKAHLLSTSLKEEVVDEAITFDPISEYMFSTSGCKRIDQKVSAFIYKDKFKDKLYFVHNEF